MSFNQRVVKCYAGGAQTAFTSPLNAFKGSQIALNTVTAGSTVSTAGLVIACASPIFDIEWESLSAIIETNLTTSTITAQSRWQVSNDGTNWLDLRDKNCSGRNTVAAAGTGSLVTTQYIQSLDGYNPGFPYLRMAIVTGAATGAAGDNVTVAYNYRRRWTR